MTPIEEAKAAGYSDDEINAYLRPKVAEAMDVGYSQDEINKHLGVTPPPAFDGAAVQTHGEASHAAYGKPVTSFMDALEAGWQISTAGLQVRGGAPSKVLAENAPMASRMANNVAMMVGDLPAMAGGAVVGAVGGAEGGPPGMAIGGVAGAMALPTALRGLMMDAYEKKQFANFGDFWERVGPIMLDTAKSWITGAATGAAGAAVGPAAGALGRAAPALSPALSSPAVLAATKTAAEIGTLTTVGAAMEGHAPTAQEFLDAAVLLGGLHFATAGAAKLRSIYAEKGIPPAAVVQDAAKDVTVKQDLLSDRGMPRLYEGADSGVSGPGPGEGEAPFGNFTISALADEHGIDATDMSHDQFFDAITDKLSQDQVAALQARMEPEHDATYAEFERTIENAANENRTAGEDAREAVNEMTGESRDKFNAELDRFAALIRMTMGRSLKDLESEYRQEVSATEASQRNAGGQQPGPSGQPAVAGQAGGGPVGGAAGIAGRPGAQAGAGGGGGGNTGGPNQPPTGVGGPGAAGSTPEQRILAHMSIGEAASTRPWTWARLYTDLVNKIFPIERAVTRIAGKNVLAAADDPGKLARLLSGATGIADRFLRFDTLNFATRQPNGPGLETILAPWRDNLNGFRAYIASRHALDLESQGIKTGFDLNDAQDVVTNGTQFQTAADELTAFSNRMAAYLRDSGVISPAAYTEMVNTRAYYVPFQRVIDKIGQGGGGMGGTLQPANPIHGQVGSERMVIDPIESIVRNAYLFTQMAERNVTGTKLVDLLLSNGEAESTSVPPPPRTPMATLRALGVGMSPDEMEALVQASRPTMGAEVRIFRAGTPETYRVDPEIATAVKGLDSQNMGDLERMLRPFANSLRAGAVLQPDFVARHTIRDFLYAVVTHPGFFSPLDMVRGFTSLAVKDADYQDWRSSGGAGVSMVSLDRRYLQTSIDQMADTGILERGWNVIANPTSTPLQIAGAVGRVPLDAARKFLISPMQMAVEFAESATHIGTFIKAKNEMLAGQPTGTPLTREQIIEAGFASRDIAVDAARMGAKMRTLNALSAFSNIAVQDTDRVVRAFVNNPLSTAFKIAGVISLPSALVWMNGHGDDRYDDAPDWVRDLFWVIPAGIHDPLDPSSRGITFRIPKPWGMGLIFGSGVERALDSFAAAKPNAFRHFASSMAGVSVPSLIPNAITPMIEQYANRSIFMNRTLVPDQMTKELPEYQYTPYTTETSKALGSLMGAFPGLRTASISEGSFGGVARALSSPILMENYLRAWTGNLGMYALQAVDKGLRSAGMLPDPVKPDDTLADIPFVKAFIVRYPTASTQPIQDFSDEYKRNKVFFDTWQAQAKEGNMEAMRHIQDLGGPMMFVQLNGIHQALGEHAKIVRDIYKNPSIPSDEKRQLIDTTYWRMTELAKAGNNTLAAAKTALTAQGGP